MCFACAPVLLLYCPLLLCDLLFYIQFPFTFFPLTFYHYFPSLHCIPACFHSSLTFPHEPFCLHWTVCSFTCGITAMFDLEGTLKGHLVQIPCNEQGHLQLDQAAQSLIRRGLERLLSVAVQQTSFLNVHTPNQQQKFSRSLAGRLQHQRFLSA